MIRNMIVLAALAAGAQAQTWQAVPAFQFDSQPGARNDADYQRGLTELDAHQWEQAVSSFDAAATHAKSNADAALYWKAYAQNRTGQREAALLTIAQLRQKYPTSRWLKDARALDLEVRAQSGSPVSPSAEQDDDLKLMAVNSLMRSDPSAAFPVLQKVLTSDNSERVKEQALFVLTQSSSPDATKLLTTIATGKANPDLQVKAIRLMGMMGNDEAHKQLASLYTLSSNDRVKRAILQSYMQSGSRDLLLHVAQTEPNPNLRRDAIRQLALTGGEEQLWQLYQSDKSSEDKKAVLQSMFLSGNTSRLVQVAKTESDPELRKAAIKSLGLMGNKVPGETMVSLFESDRDAQVRKAVLNSLFLQQNGKALVDLARREKDPEMKKEIVSKMALIHSKEVTDYMMELLK
jgi:HEAT repeat protein